MNQNENASWKCTSFQQQRQLSPYTLQAGYRDFTTSQAEQTHELSERAFGLTATGSLSLGNSYLLKLAVLFKSVVSAPLRENRRNEPLVRFQRKKNIFISNSFGFLWTDMRQYFGNLKVWLLQRHSSWLSSPEKLGLLWNIHSKTGIHRELNSASWSWYGPAFCLLCWQTTSDRGYTGVLELITSFWVEHFKITFPVLSFKVTIRRVLFSTQKSDFSCLLFS